MNVPDKRLKRPLAEDYTVGDAAYAWTFPEDYAQRAAASIYEIARFRSSK